MRHMQNPGSKRFGKQPIRAAALYLACRTRVHAIMHVRQDRWQNMWAQSAASARDSLSRAQRLEREQRCLLDLERLAGELSQHTDASVGY